MYIQEGDNELSLEEVFNKYDIYEASQSTALVRSTNDMPPAVNGSSLLGRNDFSLQEAYIAFDLRESFLQRQSNSAAAQADSIYQETEDFITKTDNIYRRDDLSIYPEPSATDEKTNKLVSLKDKYDYADRTTQSMYCPTANLVSPISQPST